jgi:transcriptional regulator with PAS, ATPase and Fis domain
MKRLVVISGSEATRRELAGQLEELFDHSVRIESYATDLGLPRKIKQALVLLTSSLVLDECKDHLDASCQVMIAKRTLNFAHLDKLYALPEGSSLLIVNDVKDTADEVVELLKKIGFTNYRYQAFYPGCPAEGLSYDYIITPGELSCAPPNASQVIDIGPRILDITTIVEVVKSLEMLSEEIHEKIHLISAKYMSKIISLGKELHLRHENVKALNEFLVRVINSVTDGILSYDRTGRIRLINSLAARLLNLGEDANILEETRRENKKLHAFLREESLDNYMLQIDGAAYLFSKIFSEASDSCLLTIKNVRERINMENTLRKELKRQGYKAKYSFDDLVHKSQVMKDLLQKARKLAASEFNIMLYGESGTGKELLASAIHRTSTRKDGPFLAVNFSALPDELIESELFGYEEGAFTGAKKGGKVGLFELANQGTLFLDEIGDISPKIQSRLLRVLQEKEILKVGGSRNIPVDVRVVAATNKNLTDMVRKGSFREDLYYRLKKLYIHIPALRERREDILPLFNHFLIQKNGFDLELTPEARHLLQGYDWPGNVRELESSVEYILAVREGDVIDRSALSEDLLLARPSQPEPQDRLTRFVLSEIHRANKARTLMGRKKLSDLSTEAQFNLSEQQMRTVLADLAGRGFVQMHRGKIGLRLTPLGRNHLGLADNG